jgi:hypothetical protein
MSCIKRQLKSPVTGHAPQFVYWTGDLGWAIEMATETSMIYLNVQIKPNLLAEYDLHL